MQRIGVSYEIHGQVYQITSYGDSAGSSVVNQVQNVYNAFQQLATQYQEHGGAVNTSTTPSVQYGYADGSANTIRPVSLTYPNGRVVNTIYNSGDDDALSRVSGLGDSSYSPLVEYTYLGLGSFVQLTYPQPGVTWTLITGAGIDPYGGLDQFGRVVNNLWENSSGAALDEIQYTYDQASNRTSRKNVVAESLGAEFDELYGYDGMQRLKSFNRGTLVEAGGQLSALSLRQNWQLDATGNWTGFQNFDQTGATPALDQQRTSDTFNEITDITATVGATWITPEYDRNGNMIVMPQPAAPTSSFTATFDAWNRLISLSLPNGASAAQYAYDGQNRQIYSSNYAFTVFNYYYSASWQLLEQQGSGPGNLTSYQFVWGLRYIDDLILRDTLELTIDPPRYYALQDANWNMDAVVDTSGAVQERYSYTAYGVVTFLDADFGPIANSNYGWEILYAGYRQDDVTRLYLARNRWLDPPLGVWITRDPIGFASGDKNPYRHVENRPLSLLDPSGQATFGSGCSAAEKAGLTQLVEAIINANANGNGRCFLDEEKERPCRSQLSQGLTDTLNSIAIDCSNCTMHATERRGYVPDGDECVKMKNAGRRGGVLGTCCAPSPGLAADSTCNSCPAELLKHSTIVLCRSTGQVQGSLPASGQRIDWDSFVRTKAGVDLARTLIHEAMHLLVGSHAGKSTARPITDCCKRPDAAVAASSFIRNCF